MSSANKKSEALCFKCIKQRDCEYKQQDSGIILIRCVDFTGKENNEEKK